MSAAAMRPPLVTASAHEYLAGRPVYVRASRRHGCCGGAALVPVAEPGAPEVLDDADRFDVAGTVVFVDRTLRAPDATWTIDSDGFARWRRLVVLGVAASEA